MNVPSLSWLDHDDVFSADLNFLQACILVHSERTCSNMTHSIQAFMSAVPVVELICVICLHSSENAMKTETL